MLAINYSPQAAALLQSGRIQLDRFKCPDWPDMIQQAQALIPVMVHFDLKAGPGRASEYDWEHIEHYMRLTDTPYVNLHLEASPKHFRGMDSETTDPYDQEQVLDRILLDVQTVVEHFGAGQVIVENVPYRGRPGKVLRPCVEPEIISQVVQQMDCGLLLDISHARIAAHHMGMDAQEYMRFLPIENLRELHFTGLHVVDDGDLRDHLPVLDSDWPWLEWVLARVRSGEWAHPWLLAFEYGGVGEKFEWRSDSSVIAAQIPKLWAMTRG